MSPLDLVKRATLRKQRLTEAQLAHLRATAYRGVDTAAHLAPTIARASADCTYRGIAGTNCADAIDGNQMPCRGVVLWAQKLS